MSRETFSDWLRDKWKRFERLIRFEIWTTSALSGKEARPTFFSLLRIFTIALRTISENRLFGQAAALSYYSLIGLGPLLAIAIMISGFILDRSEEDFAVDSMTRLIHFVAPPVAEWVQAEGRENGPPPVSDEFDEAEDLPEEALALNPELVRLIENIFEGAKSGAVGVLGSLILIVIVIQMITSVEKSFNEIWGVRRGRSWMQRVVSYWSIISLGAVLGFAALTLLSIPRIVGYFEDLSTGIPFLDLSRIIGPTIAFVLVTFILSLTNRFFPNTYVFWKPALLGSAIAALLLFANHTLSFIYVERVITQQSLYGSVGIIPVFMIGLYMFWLIVLFGGILTYAIQNANNLTNERAWNHISVGTRETLTLAALLLISRRFQACEAAPSASYLAKHLHVPVGVLNSCLSQLCDMHWISPVEFEEDDEDNEIRYQPSRPLTKICLEEFHLSFLNYGNNAGLELIKDADPILSDYLPSLSDERIAQMTLEDLLQKYPPRNDSTKEKNQ